MNKLQCLNQNYWKIVFKIDQSYSDLKRTICFVNDTMNLTVHHLDVFPHKKLLDEILCNMFVSEVASISFHVNPNGI